MTKIFVVFLILKLLVQFYLSLRNQIHIQQHRHKVPEKFAEKISLEEHQKAADYTLAKGKLGRISLILDTVFLLLWTLGGGLNSLDQFLRQYQFSSLITGTLLFALFSLIGMVLGLPESLYQTFVLEEKFGFNRTTAKTFWVDLVKQLILGALIGLPLVAALIAIMQAAGDYWWAYAWLFLSLFQLLLMWAYPTFIAPWFNKFSPLPDSPTKDKIISLLKRTDFNYQGLYVMDASTRSSHGNAYFTGLGKNKRIVFFDTLIKGLDPEEVEAVLAHELGHFKHKHILKSLIKSMLFSLIGLWVLGLLEKAPWFYQGLHVEEPSKYMALLLFSLVAPVLTFFMTPFMSWSSRKNEFEADHFASTCSSAKKLITALIKMYKDNASSLTPDPVYTAFYHSHPPALERIRHLEKYEAL